MKFMDMKYTWFGSSSNHVIFRIFNFSADMIVNMCAYT